MDCSLLGSSIHEIFQARILEWVAISFSRRSSQPRDWTQISCIVSRCFTIWATKEGKSPQSLQQNVLFLVPGSKFSGLVFDIISPISLFFIFLRILILLHLPLQLNVLIQLTSDLHFAKSNSSFSYYLSITAAFYTLLFSNHPKLEILNSAFVWVLLPYGHLVILTTCMKQPSPLHITHTHTHTEAHESTMHSYTDSLKKILSSLSYLFFSLWHMSPFDRLCIYLFVYIS